MRKFMLLLALLSAAPLYAEESNTGLPLTLEAAVRYGLAHNPDLLAALDGLGVSDAELVQAGIAKNPELTGSVGFPGKSEFVTTFNVSLTQDVLDLLLRGARRSLAQTQLEAARLRLSRVVFVQTAAMKAAYYRVQADQQEIALHQKLREVAEAASDLAERQRHAGNLSELDLIRQQAMQADSAGDFLRMQGQLELDQESLARLLGMDEAGKLEGSLAELPPGDPDFDQVQKLALVHRPEIAAAGLDVQAAEKGRHLSSGFLGMDHINVGVESQREVENVQVTGPVLQVPLPIFNQNQGAQARYRADEKVAGHRQEAERQDARFQVRQAYRRLELARNLATYYRDSLVPLRQRALVLAKAQYNNMFLGGYALLGVYREQLESNKQWIEALRDYWTARAELDCAVGYEVPTAQNPRKS